MVDCLSLGEFLTGLPENGLAPPLGSIQQHPNDSPAVGHVDAHGAYPLAKA